jgi:hypothetical protein
LRPLKPFQKRRKKSRKKKNLLQSKRKKAKKNLLRSRQKNQRPRKLKLNPLKKQWQVKLATGQKAIKLFSTQEEAINYAKGLVKTQGGSIRVHSLKGKMRKE